MFQVLVVDDDEDVRRSIANALSEAGHGVAEAADGVAAMSILSKRPFDLAVCDVQMPRLDGIALFRRIRSEAPRMSVVLMTSFGRIPDAIASLREGAADYVTKPFDPDDFAVRVVGGIVQRRAIAKRLEETRTRPSSRSGETTLVGMSPAMRMLNEQIAEAARRDGSVLISGEVGTGKKRAAERIHLESARREGPLVVIACSATDRFEHAAERVRAADSGTLVLDGIDALSDAAQRDLLHALEGARASVRAIAITRRNLADLVVEGRFGARLFLHVNGLSLVAPPLREREGDLYLLASHFLRSKTQAGHIAPSLSSRAWKALASYRFPGNVRELASVIERAIAAAGPRPHGYSYAEEIALDDLPSEVRTVGP